MKTNKTYYRGSAWMCRTRRNPRGIRKPAPQRRRGGRAPASASAVGSSSTLTTSGAVAMARWTAAARAGTGADGRHSSCFAAHQHTFCKASVIHRTQRFCVSVFDYEVVVIVILTSSCSHFGGRSCAQSPRCARQRARRVQVLMQAHAGCCNTTSWFMWSKQ